MRYMSDSLRRLASVLTVLALVLTGLGAPAVSASARPVEGDGVKLVGLKVERKTEPVGIDLDRPRFSWIISTTARDVRQESYRVRISTAGKVVWDSGVVGSDRSFDVEYDGPTLESATGYEWTVDVATNAGKASGSSQFRTGLMTAADWGGSRWVGAQPPSRDPLVGWDNYTAEFDFTIDHVAFGAFVRASNPNNALMWQVSVDGGVPRLRPHRRVNGNYTLLANPGIDISSAVTVNQLTTRSNKLSVTVGPGTDQSSVQVVTRINGIEVDSRNVTQAGTMQRGFVGFRSDFASGQPERSRAHAVKVTRTEDSQVLADIDFSTGFNPFSGGTVVNGALELVGTINTVLAPAPAAAPLLRKEFAVNGPVRNATYYVAAGGYADVSLNGSPVSDAMLSPGFADYDDTVQYAAFDVTDRLVEGPNAIGMELGREFFSMTGGNVWNWERPTWRDEPMARGILHIDYADGSTERVVTDDSWTYHEGPTRFDDLYAGERYDARFAVPGWNSARFDDSTWSAPRIATGPRGVLVNQRQQPVRVTRSFPAVAITEPAPGVYVVEFPNVIAGMVEYTVRGPAGTTIRAAHAEKLLANGRVNMSNNGGFQAGFQTDYFTLAGTGEPETWMPTFSYKGFKYIEVTGWPGDGPPPLSAFTAKRVNTDAEQTGRFEASNGTLTGVHEIVVNTLYNNIHHIPTDTPMFEKNGWTGDATVGAEMFLLNMDTHELFAKWLRDVHESREVSGSRAGAPMVIAPSSGNWGAWGPSQPWHAAYIMIPYWLYQYGGDDRVMTELYDGMKGYIDLEYGQRRANGTVISNRLGDWVSPTGSPAGGHAPDEDNRVSGTAYLYQMLRTMERVAQQLGKATDAAQFAAKADATKTAFNNVYFQSSQDRYRGEGADANRYRQVHNVLALAFNLTPDEEVAQRVADRLAQDVVERGYHLDTGTLGTKYLLPVLTQYGHEDVAYRVATQTTYPSWGYKLANGATTVWEHWSVQARSLGHYFLGTLDDWNYHYVAGIRPSAETGYRDITIAPAVTGLLDHASATTQTPWGPVSSNWRQQDRRLSLDVHVPVGTTATVEVPGANRWAVSESGRPVADAPGVHEVTVADGVVRVVVGSGDYRFGSDEQLGLVGAAIDATQPLAALVDAARRAGHLNPGQAQRLSGAAATSTARARDAHAALLTGDTRAAARHLAASHLALESMADILGKLNADGLKDLVTAVDRAMSAVSAAASDLLGLSLKAEAGSDVLRPGDRVPVQLAVANAGSERVVNVRGSLTGFGKGWATTPSWVRLTNQLPPGGTGGGRLELAVPEQQRPGTVRGDAEATYVYADATLTVRSPLEVSVQSPVVVESVTAEPAEVRPGASARVTATVRNIGRAATPGRLRLDLPEGWQPVAGADLTVPAGQTRSVALDVVVPRAARQAVEDYPLTARFVRDDEVLATGTGAVRVAITPNVTDALDHVDLGNASSEQAHRLTAAPSSGTNTEAGLTRRYAGHLTPFSWFEFDLAVTPGEAFVIRAVETYDRAQVKRYKVYVDGEEVLLRTFERTAAGAGTETYELVVPASLAAADGSVRIRFENQDDPAYFDPSIADVWSRPVS
ncbi:hypothetical protein C1I95_11155 [Micromonospora craterilacus]|uniref:alpha-L-rhamnosidase n=2 Tax=Micromonospora craterilacus TaxID=1655439 RepID=A0A2W2ET97_9ACTN|nr:hypothetical protein C1I95_11155 [Micromonospora craterilacus]